MKISALIRAREIDENLKNAVKCLLSQSRPPDEIIIVDSSGDDEIARWCRLEGLCHEVYPPGKEFNYSKALNLGFLRASGDHVLIFSQHCLFIGNTDLAVLSSMVDPERVCAIYSSNLSPEVSAHSVSKENLPRLPLSQVIWLHNFNGYNGLQNHCSLVSKAAWDLHPFDESLPTCEDQEFALWHFRNTGLVTISLEGLGLKYLNRYENRYRIGSAALICAEYFNPALRKPSVVARSIFYGSVAIFRHFDFAPLLSAFEMAVAFRFRARIIPRLASNAKGRSSVLAHLLDGPKAGT